MEGNVLPSLRISQRRPARTRWSESCLAEPECGDGAAESGADDGGGLALRRAPQWRGLGGAERAEAPGLRLPAGLADETVAVRTLSEVTRRTYPR